MLDLAFSEAQRRVPIDFTWTRLRPNPTDLSSTSTWLTHGIKTPGARAYGMFSEVIRSHRGQGCVAHTRNSRCLPYQQMKAPGFLNLLRY